MSIFHPLRAHGEKQPKTAENELGKESEDALAAVNRTTSWPRSAMDGRSLLRPCLVSSALIMISVAEGRSPSKRLL